MRSPQTTGEDQPAPRISVFHATFSVELQVSGGSHFRLRREIRAADCGPAVNCGPGGAGSEQQRQGELVILRHLVSRRASFQVGACQLATG